MDISFLFYVVGIAVAVGSALAFIASKLSSK